MVSNILCRRVCEQMKLKKRRKSGHIFKNPPFCNFYQISRFIGDTYNENEKKMQKNIDCPIGNLSICSYFISNQEIVKI